MNRARIAVVATIVVGAMLVPAAPALASAPDNDLFDGAVNIVYPDDLPFTVSLDTTEATTDTDGPDTELNEFCQAPATDASVWYSITPTVDTQLVVSTVGTDYSAGVFVATGMPMPDGSFSIEACAPLGFIFFATAAVTYYILVIDDQEDGGGNGGSLEFLVDVPPPDECPGVNVADPVFAGANVIIGTDGDDDLEGTDGVDLIIGKDGNDKIHAGDGDDWLAGCAGDDHIRGDDGNDMITGDDLAFFGIMDGASGGNDTIDGGEGNDEMLGGPGDDDMDGGPGDDAVIGNQGRDDVDGDDGDDFVAGGIGNDDVDGGDGNDFLSGGPGDDELEGDAGDDFLTGDFPDLEADLGAGPGQDPNPNEDECDGGSGTNEIIFCEEIEGDDNGDDDNGDDDNGDDDVDGGFLTPAPAYITLDGSVPADSWVKPIITVGESVDGVMFEGIPDGIGITDTVVSDNGDDDNGDDDNGDDDNGDDDNGDDDNGDSPGSIDVYVNHEQTTIPFFGEADFQDASVTKWTLSTEPGHEGEVLGAEIAISSDLGYKRFCSASMATPAEGFDTPVFLTGEEANDITDVPAGAPYGADPSVAPQRQAGYAVVLDTATGESTPIPGMGRLNHENTIALPGYNELALLTTDDTFSGPSAQLYLYLADDQDDLFEDDGKLYAFQVTHDDDGRVDRNHPFNGANDYLDLEPGDEFEGRFIRVPEDVAKGTTGDPPQQALEDWSNDNNVFQFIRLEDIAYDKNDPQVVYIADTGRSRVVPDPTTGRLTRGPSGTSGLADNGRMFKMVFDDDDPKEVESFTVLADGDQSGSTVFVPFESPDNIDTSVNSLMVQEDADNAKIWRYDLGDGTWTVVATVNDPEGESSGIVDASNWYGEGSWLLDVQAHGTFVEEEQRGDTLFKREDGQLMLMRIPGS